MRPVRSKDQNCTRFAQVLAAGYHAYMPTAEPSSPLPSLRFDAVLQPHRSLGRTGFLILMTALCAISFAAGMAFLLIGAWPVFGFFGLDMIAVYVAFWLSYRSGRLVETLQLGENELVVTRISPSGHSRQWRFAPNWLQVRIASPPHHHSQLTLSSHGRHLAVGSFLTPEERLEVATALRDALAKWREPLSA